MIQPESTIVPSRSKRTTGKRIGVMLTTRPQDPLDAPSCGPACVALLGFLTGAAPAPGCERRGYVPAALGEHLLRVRALQPRNRRSALRDPLEDQAAAAEAGVLRRRRLGRGILDAPARPRAACSASATRSPADPKARSSPTERRSQFGVFRCSSSKGLRCVNSTGNGFFLSKEHSYTYKEPALGNGSFKTPSANIVCGWSVAPDGTASMECGIKSGLKPPPKPIHCDAGDPNDKRVSLRDTGRAAPVLCAGDPGRSSRRSRQRRACLPTERAAIVGDHVHVGHDGPHLP